MAGSIRQRGKQSWEVRAFVGKDPVTGKKQYATKTIRGEKRDAEIARITNDAWRSPPSCGGSIGPDAYLFSHEVDFSQPWRPNYATLAFSRLRTELGLNGVKLHHLRHFSATQLLASGIDIRTVSGRLGHANASTTLDIYAQFVEQADERAAVALGALLSSNKTTSELLPSEPRD